MSLSAGSKLGPYEIQSPLGAGGMGEVYRARDTRLDRTVAIKVLPLHLSSNPELNARFEREARSVSAMNHPNICHLYDIGTQSGTAFLVMEYLDGETLADRLRKGPMSLKQALEYGIQICDALAAAHRAGILHRDLKPQNVMLTASGAKLLDFGLAKSAPALGSGSNISGLTPSTPTMTIAELSAPAHPLTKQGTVVGTFQYMAPEVLQGREADPRSDVFALGCVLYEMVTGRRPFEGKSQLSVMTSILENDPAPVSQIMPTSPATLDHLIRSCLEKNPDERIQTAQDVKLQLKWISSGGAAQPAVSTSQAKRSSLPWILAILALAVALLSGGAYLRVLTHAQPVTKSSILPPAGTSFVTMAPASGPPVISPDGTRLAFSGRDSKGSIELYVRALNSMTAQMLPGTDEATYPFWSADSRQIGFFAIGKLKKIDANGGPAQIICDAANARGGAWNRDGVILFAPSVATTIFRVPDSGGTPEPASKFDSTRFENSHRWPFFLPDGQHFLFWARTSLGSAEQTLYVGKLGALQSTILMKGIGAATYGSGYLLTLRDQTLLAQPFDADGLKLSGASTPIAERITVNDATSVPEFSASNNGTLIYQTGDARGSWDLLWFSRDGKQTGAVAQQEPYYYPALSPDQSKVAVSLFQGAQGTANIWILDLERGTKSRLSFGNGTQIGSQWSPDGKTLYYSSDSAGGQRHIFARSVDGSGAEQTILNTPEASSELLQSISPDGKYLVYGRMMANDPHKNSDIWALPLFGDGKPFAVVATPFDDLNGAISPSGKWMAYHNNESGRNEVYITSFPTGSAKWQVSTNGGVDAKWRGDGKELFFLDPSDNLLAVDVDTSGGSPKLGVPHALFQPMGVQRQVGTYVVTPDGKRFLVNSGNTKQGNEPLTLVTNWSAELKK